MNMACSVSWLIVISGSLWGFVGSEGWIVLVSVCLMMSLRSEWARVRWCLHRFVFLFPDSQESNNEYGCSYSVMRVVGNGSTVILNSISLAILSDDQLKCNGQPAVFRLRTVYTCIFVTCREKKHIVHLIHISDFF